MGIILFVILPFLIITTVVGTILQKNLSLRKNKYLGLILPIIVTCLNVKIMAEVVIELNKSQNFDTSSHIFFDIGLFIGAILYLMVIYLICRERVKAKANKIVRGKELSKNLLIASEHYKEGIENNEDTTTAKPSKISNLKKGKRLKVLFALTVALFLPLIIFISLVTLLSVDIAIFMVLIFASGFVGYINTPIIYEPSLAILISFVFVLFTGLTITLFYEREPLGKGHLKEYDDEI